MLNVMVDAAPEVRAGRFSDLSLIRTNGSVSIIDFALSDNVPDESGNIPAVLVSRISMTNEAVVALRDMLVRHTQNWTVAQETADAD